MTNDENAQGDREENLRRGEERLRQLAAERGFDWRSMGEEDRLAFVDDLIHEDRAFRKGEGFNGQS